MSAEQALWITGCPRCAQSTGEWCAEWQEGIGMVVKDGLVHPERVTAAEFTARVRAGLDGGSVHVATEEDIARAAEELI